MEPDFVLPSINDLAVNQPRHQPSTAAIERVFSVAGFIVSSTLLSNETFEFLLFNHLNSDLRAFGGRVDEFVSCRKRTYKDWAVKMLVKRLSAIIEKNIGDSLGRDGTQDAHWELGRKLGGGGGGNLKNGGWGWD